MYAFHFQVSDKDAPGYSKKIAHPMDLSTVRSKIEARRYGNVLGLHQDLCRIFDNCVQFNGPNSGVTLVRSMCSLLLWSVSAVCMY